MSYESNRREIVSCLSDQLSQMCLNSNNRNQLPKKPQSSCSDEYGDSAFEKRRHHRQELRLKLELSPEWDQVAVQSPISPSYAMANAKREQQQRQVPRPTSDHQICFGMDRSSMIESSNQMGASYFEDGNGNTRSSNLRYEDSSGISSTASELHPTHRVQHAFIPRHSEEVLLEMGDPVYVERECEDHWCQGSNLRTGQQGIFPVAHVFEVDIYEDLGNLFAGNMGLRSFESDTFYLTFLGSMEVGHHKGNDVLVQAINKVLNFYQNKEELVVPKSVLLEISFRGIHLIDKGKKNVFRCPSFDYFYTLQNVSFCGAHPKQLRYFGFITKHPLLPRFACHVFLSQISTQPIVEAIGRAFKKSYDEYMAFAHPTEDIYLE